MSAQPTDRACEAGPATQSHAYRWLVTALRFAAVETAAYLRDRSAIFWTFIYPVVLLLLLIWLFGSRTVALRVDVEGEGVLAERLIASLQQRMAYVRDVRLTIRRVRPDEASPADRLRLVVAERAADGDAPGTAVLLRLDSPPDAGNGALLAIVGEAVAQLNLQLANAPATIRVDYAVDQGPPQSSVAPGSAGYYVTGLAVLTMVSTALFGFSGPLIELRARGGLKLFRVMPVHRTAFLAGFALCRVSILVVFSLVFLIAGLAVLAGMPLRGAVDWTLVGVLVVAGAVAFMAAGLALAGVIVNNTVATAVINLLNLPIMFLSDLFIPLALMPDSIQTVARWSPVYQLAVAIRMAVVGDAVPAYSVLSLAALAVVSIAVAAATFRWTVRR